MRFKQFLGMLVSLLLIYMPVMQAGTPTMLGKANITGATEINGTIVPASATVFFGDRVATRENGSATMSVRDGDRLFLSTQTAVKFEGDAKQLVLSLERGALAVANRSKEPLVVYAGGARVASKAETNAVYEVKLEGNALRVLTHKGTALVTSADRTVEVKEGMMLDATMAPPGPNPQSVGGLTGFQAWAVVIAVAAGVTGLVLGVAALTRANPEDCRAVSPSFVLSCD